MQPNPIGKTLRLEPPSVRGALVTVTVMASQAERTVTTTKFSVDDEGKRKPLEIVERVEELPPDLDAQIKVMERLYPERWGKVDRQEHTVSGQVDVKVTVDPKDVVDKMRARIEEAERRQLEAGEIVDAEVVEDPAAPEAGAA